MIEIFIPTKIKNFGVINEINNTFFDLIDDNFKEVKLTKFSSTFFEGIKLKSDIFLKDLIILCNGSFGSMYFADFDYLKNDFNFLGSKIIGENQIGEQINNIMLNITFVTGELTSDKLLTNTKKDEIKNKIDLSLYSLSGIIFLLYSLLEKTSLNIEELDNYDGLIEYKGQASLLSETSLTKKIEIQASIDKLEGKIELFISTIKSLIK